MGILDPRASVAADKAYLRLTDITPATNLVTLADLQDTSARLATLETAGGIVARPSRPATTAQPSFWLRGDQITQSAGAISTWTDNVGGVTFAVPASRTAPTYSATAVKGKPGAVFSRSANSGLYFPKPVRAEAQTALVVFSVAALGVAQGLIQGTDSTATATNLSLNTYYHASNAVVAGMNGNTGTNAFSGTTLAAAGPLIARFGWGTGTGVGTASTKPLTASLNGGTVGTSNTQSVVPALSTGFTLGGAGTAASSGPDANIAEVIIFDTLLSVADQQAWTQYLAATYNITVGNN